MAYFGPWFSRTLGPVVTKFYKGYRISIFYVGTSLKNIIDMHGKLISMEIK